MVKDSPFEIVGKPRELFRGKWLYVKEIQFKRQNSDRIQEWECAFRTTRVNHEKPDGVDVIATLRKNNKRYFILIKQYRFPMEGYCLEFPAGLVDPDESVIEAGLRELKEETGYTSNTVVSCSSGNQPLDPGLSNDCVNFITVEVDGDAEENRNPKQKLEEGEAINVELVECEKLLDHLNSVSGSVHIEAMLYSFATGFHLGCSFNPTV
uniref:Nudix hydrolase domain-containing protein n=1 Tax=Syphacia muris TaxID=451379 RepID=A0A0N5AII5_9BILA